MWKKAHWIKQHLRKRVDQIQVGDFTVNEVEIDFNDFGYDDINGLLGLDLLMETGYIIDLSQLQMNKSN